MGKFGVLLLNKSISLFIVPNCSTKPLVDESSVVFSDIKDAE